MTSPIPLPAPNESPLKDIGSLSVAEIGWKRLNGHILRWTGQPLNGTGGRDMLQLKGRGMDLVITSAWLAPGIDPDDEEAVTEALEDGWDATLPLPALVVLRHGLNTAIAVMEADQGITIGYGDKEAS